jgi:F-box interacting protein
MAQGNDGDDNRNADSLAEETTLTSPPLKLPTLPFDLLPEILCRLPVKLLVQLRCLCKFFNSLISDPKFAKKHLQLSTKRHHLMLTNAAADDELVMYDSPIPSILSPSTVFTQTQLYLPSTLPNNELYNKKVLCCCDGMFCGELNLGSYFLWNPSIAKFKLLPPLENPGQQVPFTISFGYDHSIDNYKVVAVSHEFEVCVYTLGTDYWREIEEMPYYDRHSSGIFACGTVNWISSTGGCWDVIISLDLEEESYQELYPPDFGDENDSWELGVLRDCLCVFASSDEYWDVWIMKEYGNEESWTNLYTIPNELLYIKSLQDQHLVADAALYVSENDQLLVQCYELDDMQRRDNMKLVVYDSKTGTLNIPEFQNNYEHTDAIVYIESLISP